MNYQMDDLSDDVAETIPERAAGDVETEPCELLPEPREEVSIESQNALDSAKSDSGLKGLTKYSTPEEISTAVQKFVKETHSLGSVDLGIAKHELHKKLKAIKFQGAGDFVKSLFKENPSVKKSSINVAFEDPEPWSDPVDGDELLREISDVISRYVILPDGGNTAISLWILFSWTYDAFDISPLLDFSSPAKRCGKSTGLRVLSRLVPKPLMAANISTAALFRSIEHFRPTLLIDEVDTFLKFNVEINGVLNAGHERDGAFVLRVEGDDHQLKRFCVWGPKIISGIGRRKDTLEDRSIRILMSRKGAGEKVEKLRQKNLEAFSELKRRAARWSADNFETAQGWEPAIPDSLNDRAGDNWGPLLTIAEMAGGHWPELAREAALILSGSDDGDDDAVGIMLLADIANYFQENEADRISSDELEVHLNGLEDRPWPEYRKGRAISKAGIARLLKPFEVTPNSIRVGTRTPKGYLAEWFSDVFLRYLPERGIQSATPATRLNNKELNGFQSATQGGHVAVEKDNNSFKNNACCGVAVRTGDSLGNKKKGENPNLGLFEVQL